MPALVATTDLVSSCFPLSWAFILCCSHALSKWPQVFLPSFVQLCCQEYFDETGRFWSVLQAPACQAVANRYRNGRQKRSTEINWQNVLFCVTGNLQGFYDAVCGLCGVRQGQQAFCELMYMGSRVEYFLMKEH